MEWQYKHSLNPRFDGAFLNCGNGGMAVQGGSGAKFTGAIEHDGDFANRGSISNNGVDIGAGHTHVETNGAETGAVIP